jgi:hypothetical protein
VRSNELRRIQKTRVSHTREASKAEALSVLSATITNFNKRKGKPIMGRMKELYTQILECETCNGQGWEFFGNETDYDVQACDCNPLGFFQENK